MQDIIEVIEKHFKNERSIFFHQSDKHQIEEPDAYLRYELKQGKLFLYCGSNNGEICLLITDHNSDGLDQLITTIIHN